MTTEQIHTKKYTEKNRRDEVFGKEQDGDRYTEEKMERYIQKTYNIERDLQSMRHDKRERRRLNEENGEMRRKIFRGDEDRHGRQH